MAGLPRLKGHLTSTEHFAKPRTVKANSKAKSDKVTARNPSNEAVLAHEARILSLLSTLNFEIITAELPNTIQAVKAALYKRDFARAFGSETYLKAYFSRWVPGRALAYRDLFTSIDALTELRQHRAFKGENTKVLCIGGGACSELIALASLCAETSVEFGNSLRHSGQASPQSDLHVTLVDLARWDSIVLQVQEGLRTAWQLATQSFSSSFVRSDILEDYASLDLADQNVITLLFTTNELLVASKTKTLALLGHLSSVCKSGVLLIVAESAGSYSEVNVGTKTYPLDLILDQTLAGQNGAWAMTAHESSRWYRFPEQSQAHYPLPLENMRMMLRVYTKH